MKKRICFAGFGEVEMVALQPSLAGLSGAWDCVFSPDEGAALNAMGETACDATVVNLNLGGIDSNFLHQASVRFPKTLRFVLGDVADREMIVNCTGGANQFISKPWKPPELIAIVERSLALDAWLSNDKLRSFIPRLGNLPGLPATYFEILKKAESPLSSVNAIAEIIARDPALTARLLQMVNSPACGLAEKITSPAEAVSMLGIDAVKALVLCLQVFAEKSPSHSGSISMEELWGHSFSVAKIASKIVVQCINSERMASDAYTAGLLHNIGRIVMATNLAREYSTVVSVAAKRKCALEEVEMELLGVTSNQVGAYLLGLWGLPLPIVEATALYPTPAKATPVEFSLLTVVHVANVLAHEDKGKSRGLPLPELDGAYLATLDLPRKTDDWRKLLTAKPVNAPVAEKADRPAGRPPPPRHSESIRAPARSSGSGGSLGKLLAVAGLVAIVAAVMAFKPKVAAILLHRAAPDTEVIVPAAAAQPGAAASPAEPGATASPFDAVRIQSIIYSAAHPVVLINGTALEVGGHLGKIEVSSITRNTVILDCEGRKKVFNFK